MTFAYFSDEIDSYEFNVTRPRIFHSQGIISLPGASIRMINQEDRDLVNGLCTGEPKYHNLLVDRYYSRLLSFIMKYFGFSYHDASDVVNATFEKIIKKIDTFDFNRCTSLSTWIAKIAKNTGKDKIKQLKRETTFSIEEHEESGLYYSELLWQEQQIEDSELALLSKKILKQALECLSETDRKILIERAAGFEHKQIGDWLNKSQNAVKVAHHRALKKLKQKYIELIESLSSQQASELNAYLNIEEPNGRAAN